MTQVNEDQLVSEMIKQIDEMGLTKREVRLLLDRHSGSGKPVASARIVRATSEWLVRDRSKNL